MAIITSNWLLDIVMCAFGVLLLFYLYMARNFNYWKNRGVKQIQPIPFFGNIAQCILGIENPPKFFSNFYKKGAGENMIGFYVLDKPYLLLRDPELIKDVFIKDFNNFSNKLLTGNSTDAFGANNIFLAANPPWRQLRQKMTPIFTLGKIKNMFNLMLEICKDFDTHMDTYEIDDKVGKPVEVTEVCAKLMTDIIGTTAFGIRFNSLVDPDAEFRKYGRAMFKTSYKRYLQMVAIFFVPALRWITNAQFFGENGTQFFRTTFWDVINERKKTGIKRQDLIDTLIGLMKDQDDDKSDSFKLEGDALVAQAAIFFSGGFETSATTSYFALYEIAKNQDIQNRLRKEILEGLKKDTGQLNYETITALPYLNMVVYEALRMYPVLPFIDRVSEEDYTFSGTNITIDKGTPIILPARCMHFDSNYFPDPYKFDPERFSPDGNIIPFTFYPFGEGPRGCLGIKLGLIQVKIALISFLSKYELTFCPQTPNPMKLENLTVITNIKGDLYLNLRKIS